MESSSPSRETAWARSQEDVEVIALGAARTLPARRLAR
jgi:hypothetical protein